MCIYIYICICIYIYIYINIYIYRYLNCIFVCRISTTNCVCAYTFIHTYNIDKMYSGTPPYGHLTSKVTSPLGLPILSPKLYSTVQVNPL